MVTKRAKKISVARKQLGAALKLYHSAKTGEEKALCFLTVVKGFEVLVEYAWKVLKQQVEDEGLEAPSPKEAVRQAAAIGKIDDPELWLSFISARNLSVHDYFGIPEEKYLLLTKRLLEESEGF